MIAPITAFSPCPLQTSVRQNGKEWDCGDMRLPAPGVMPAPGVRSAIRIRSQPWPSRSTASCALVNADSSTNCFAQYARGRGQVRHSYTISTLPISIWDKLHFIKCRYGRTDCLARYVKSGGDAGHGKSGRHISAYHCLVSVTVVRLILCE
jgi:hypothetical protein